MKIHNLVYKHATLPANKKKLICDVNEAALRIRYKLSAVGLPGPKMDGLYRQYYKKLLENLDSKLCNCSYHLIWGLSSTRECIERIVLIDHGGGLGLNGLVAKELGVGTVIYNDIDSKFLEAAKNIAGAIGKESDEYVLGDIDVLIDKLRANSTNADVLISYDVIEHIYDNGAFLSKIHKVSDGPLALFMSSGANMFNPRYLLYVIPRQIKSEKAYWENRRQIIEDCGFNLNCNEIRLLCKATRMLVRKEIEEVVKAYIKKGIVVKLKKSGINAYDPFGSNTVDPETGWWSEHLMNPYHLAQVLSKCGFKAKIIPGFYSRKGSAINIMIRTLGAPLALPICAFYSVYAIKDK